MIITITSLNLKSPLVLFRHYVYAFRVLNQLRTTNCISHKTRGLWTMQYTMSLWRNEKDMLAFARSNDHLHAVRNVYKIAREVRILTMNTDGMLSWKEGRRLLEKQGKALSFP